jgi:hypothetical protein
MYSKGECRHERLRQRATRARKVPPRHDTTKPMQATIQFYPTRSPRRGKVHRFPRQWHQLSKGHPLRVALANLTRPKRLVQTQMFHKGLSHLLASPKEQSHHHKHVLRRPYSSCCFFLILAWLAAQHERYPTHLSSRFYTSAFACLWLQRSDGRAGTYSGVYIASMRVVGRMYTSKLSVVLVLYA